MRRDWNHHFQTSTVYLKRRNANAYREGDSKQPSVDHTEWRLQRSDVRSAAASEVELPRSGPTGTGRFQLQRWSGGDQALTRHIEREASPLHVHVVVVRRVEVDDHAVGRQF